VAYRSRSLHRDHLIALGKTLAGSDDPLAVVEAHHVARMITDHTSTWVGIDNLMAHPSWAAVGHLVAGLPPGHNPRARLDIGDIAYVSPDGLGIGCLPGVIARLESEDFGEGGPEIRARNATTAKSGDGVLHGIFTLTPMQARQGQGRTALRARAYVCIYADGTRPTTLIAFAVESVANDTPVASHPHEPQRIGRTT
jgi:hypothetical protein